MWILILSLFYIFSILLTWIVIYFQEKNKIITFGDLLDETPTVMYIPVFNGLLIICYLIALLIINIEEKILKKLQGRNKNIWTKIRNIKLKKNEKIKSNH